MTTLLPALLRSQVLVGGGTPDGSAVLELQSVTGGVLLPRMTRTQRVAIFSPATGLMLYNTTSKCLEVNVGTPTAAEWARANCLSGSITTLDCSNAVVTGTLTSGQVASGVSASIPFTGGNRGVLEIQTVASSGVTLLHLHPVLPVQPRWADPHDGGRSMPPMIRRGTWRCTSAS